ncbi:MAG TPA: ester cyclase [Egibacteraceae bacterium]|nr:ester cyclase [Egibacteraceae bacterium]
MAEPPVKNANTCRHYQGVRMKKANLELIRARYDAVNAHDLDRFQECYASAVVWRDPAVVRPVKGPVAVRNRLQTWIEAVPNLKWTLDELFGEGDRLCAQFTFTGSHRGVLNDGRGNDLAASRRSIRIRGVGVYVVEAGKIVDSTVYFDLGAFRAAPSTQ